MDTNTEVIQAINEIVADSEKFSTLLLVAPDAIRKNRIVERLARGLLKLDNSDQSISSKLKKLDATGLTSSKIVLLQDEVSSLSLFSQHNLFLFEKTEKISSATAKDLLKLIRQAPPATTFIFSAARTPRPTSFVKYFKEKKKFFPLLNLEKPEKANRRKEEKRIAALRSWIGQELKQAGISTWPESLFPLIRSLSNDCPDKITRIIEQLALYSDNSETTEGDFHALFEELPDINDFKFIEALEQRNTSAAEIILKKILASGRSPFPLLALIYRTYFQHLTIVSMLKKGRSATEIKEKLSLPDWLANKKLNTASNFSAECLKKYLGTILRIDSKLKGRSLDEEAVFGELISELTTQ